MSRKVIKKVCMLGDGAVGKTSLIRRYVFDQFKEDYTPTIGTKIVKKTIELPERDIELTFMIWDIMGHKSYHEVPLEYYQGVEGTILVADITRKETLENTSYWLKGPFKKAGKKPTVLVVNKADLENEAQFGNEETLAKAQELEVEYHYVSAKTGEKVESIFREMAEKITEGM